MHIAASAGTGRYRERTGRPGSLGVPLPTCRCPVAALIGAVSMSFL